MNPRIALTGIGDQFVDQTHNFGIQPPIITDFAAIQLSRTSISPLVSEFILYNFTADLNGTIVNCSSREGLTSTIINIIDNGILYKSIILLYKNSNKNNFNPQ